MLQTTLPSLVAHQSASVSFDGLDLTSEQQTALRLHVAEFRASEGRIVNEFVLLAARTAMMKELLGEKFMVFAKSVLKMHPRTIQRYLSLNEFMTKRLSTDGRIDFDVARQFTQSAMTLLAPVTDDDVIAEVKELAGAGQKINDEVVQRIIASRNVDYESRVKLAESEAAAAVTELAEEKKRRELETAQHQNHSSRQDEIIRRSQEKVKVLEEDLARLQRQATIVTEKIVEKEVIPAGYQTLQDAIAAAQTKLQEARAQEHIARQDAETAERMADSAQARLNAFTAETEGFVRIKSVVEETLKTLPQAQLQALASKDKKVSAALQAMGDLLIQLGSSLQTTAAKAA